MRNTGLTPQCSAEPPVPVPLDRTNPFYDTRRLRPNTIPSLELPGVHVTLSRISNQKSLPFTRRCTPIQLANNRELAGCGNSQQRYELAFSQDAKWHMTRHQNEILICREEFEIVPDCKLSQQCIDGTDLNSFAAAGCL